MSALQPPNALEWQIENIHLRYGWIHSKSERPLCKTFGIREQPKFSSTIRSLGSELDRCVRVGSAGFEPATFAVSGRRPNQASPTRQRRLRRRAPRAHGNEPRINLSYRQIAEEIAPTDVESYD